MSSAVISPPAATTGTSTAVVTAVSSSSSGSVAGCADGSKVPRCPPADGPCATSASTPRATASRASASVVTVPTVVMPAPRSRRAFVLAGQAERERRHLRPQIEQHVELGRPVVVVESGLAEPHTVAIRPPVPAPRRSARSRRASPHWAAAQTDWRPPRRTSAGAPRRGVRRTPRPSGSPPGRTRAPRRWSRRPPARGSTDHPPSARRSPEPRDREDRTPSTLRITAADIA